MSSDSNNWLKPAPVSAGKEVNSERTRLRIMPCKLRNKSVSRILYSDQGFQISKLKSQNPRTSIFTARSEIPDRNGDHSSSPTVADWIKRPTRKLRAGSPDNASLFGLAPRGVCLAAHVATRAGALLLVSNLKFQFETSPYGPHRFTHHLRFRFEISKSDSRRLVYSLLHLSSPVPSCLKFQNSNLRLEMIGRPAVSGLAALWCSDFPLPRISIPISNRKLRFQREAAITRLAPNCKAAGL